MSKRFRPALTILIMSLAATAPCPLVTAAQENTLAVDGSAALLVASQRAAEGLSGVHVVTPAGGTDAGLGQFCNGDIHIANAARPISPEEEALCAENNIPWVELRAGYMAPALVAAPNTQLPACLTLDELARAWATGATNWRQIIFDFPDLPVQLVASQTLGDDQMTHFTADLGLGIGQLAEAEAGATPEDIGALLGDTAIGVLDWSDYDREPGLFTLVEVDAGRGCAAPSEATIRDGTYPFAHPLYIYVRADVLGNQLAADYLNALFNTLSADPASISGVVPPSDDDNAINWRNFGEGVTGRVFSAPAYTLPNALPAERVAVNSHPALYPFAFGIGQDLLNRYANTDLQIGLDDDATALARICAGELDVALLSDNPTEEQLVGCAADVTAFEIGHVAVTLVANHINDAVDCLSMEELRLIWQPESEGEIVNWDQVREGLPTLNLFTCGPEADRYLFDFFTEAVTGEAGAIRLDYASAPAEQVFRCATEPATPGGLVFIGYDTYAAHRDQLRLLAVDGGEGCVLPGPVSARAQHYALAHPVVLLAQTEALSREPVLLFVWSLLTQAAEGDEAFAGLGFIPPGRADLEDNLTHLLEAAGR